MYYPPQASREQRCDLRPQSAVFSPCVSITNVIGKPLAVTTADPYHSGVIEGFSSLGWPSERRLPESSANVGS